MKLAVNAPIQNSAKMHDDAEGISRICRFLRLMEQTIVEKKLPGEHETPVQKACYTQQKNN
jgi:hypothetical protein